MINEGKIQRTDQEVNIFEISVYLYTERAGRKCKAQRNSFFFFVSAGLKKFLLSAKVMQSEIVKLDTNVDNC